MVDEGIVSLNLLGFLCPVPVHETRRAVEEATQGTLFEVLCENRGASGADMILGAF